MFPTNWALLGMVQKTVLESEADSHRDGQIFPSFLLLEKQINKYR